MKGEKIFYKKLEKHLTTAGFEFENKGKNSKQFKMDKANIVRTELNRLFDISIEEEYFNEVCNGTGSEIDKITSI